MKVAKRKKSVGLLGGDGGKCVKLCDQKLLVPTSVTAGAGMPFLLALYLRAGWKLVISSIINCKIIYIKTIILLSCRCQKNFMFWFRWCSFVKHINDYINSRPIKKNAAK